jgi:hypothetical protein
MGVLFVKSANLRVISILVFCLMTQIGYAQNQIIPINSCPNPNGSKLADFAVDWFLLSAVAKEDREKVGATNEAAEEKMPVSDETICAKLNQIVRDNPEYKKIEDNLAPDRTRYQYRTENYYYIFWSRKPEFETPRTGPKRLFIIISKDFENIWEIFL